MYHLPLYSNLQNLNYLQFFRENDFSCLQRANQNIYKNYNTNNKNNYNNNNVLDSSQLDKII